MGVQFGNNSGAIEVRDTGHNLALDQFTFTPIRDNRPVGLEVNSGNTLALLGGEINLTGGNLTAARGNVELGSVGEVTTISLNPTDNGFTFDYEEINNFGDLNLTQAASIDVSGSAGGSINLRGKNISILENSAIIANTLGTDNGGNVETIASDSIKLISTDEGLFPSAIFTQVEADATGNGDLLFVDTNNLKIVNNAFISQSAVGAGDGRDLSVKANKIEIIGGISSTFYRTGIFSQVLSSGKGSAGDVTIKGDRLIVQNGASIDSSTFGEGNGGNLTVDVSDIEFIGVSPDNVFPSSLFSASAGTGNAGDLTLTGDR